MNSRPTRDLSPAETNCVKLLDYVENLIDQKKLTGALSIKNEAIDAMEKYHIAKPLKVIPVANATVCQVYFETLELLKYVRYTCKIAGLTIEIDGTVKTRDGLTLERADLN